MITYRCNYHDLIRGIDYYNGAQWRWEVEQCPADPTNYVQVDQEFAGDQGVTHLVNVCAEHEVQVRGLAGFVSSEPKKVFA